MRDVFDLLHGYDEETGAVTTQPGACPACVAHFLFAPAPSVGGARGLVLTLIGVPSYVKEHRSVEDFLRANCPTPEAVDAYRALVMDLDYDAWSAMNQDLSRGRRPTVVQRQENAALPRLRAMAATGELTRRLDEAVERVKTERCAERGRYLAIFNVRHGERLP